MFFSSVLPKWQNNFLKCRIHVGRTNGIIKDLTNYIFSFCYPGSVLPPTRSDIGSYLIRLCGFCHALATVLGRHGADGSALAWFVFVNIWLVTPMRRSLFSLSWFVVPLPWHRQILVIDSCQLIFLCKKMQSAWYVLFKCFWPPSSHFFYITLFVSHQIQCIIPPRYEGVGYYSLYIYYIYFLIGKLNSCQF